MLDLPILAEIPARSYAVPVQDRLRRNWRCPRVLIVDPTMQTLEDGAAVVATWSERCKSAGVYQAKIHPKHGWLYTPLVHVHRVGATLRRGIRIGSPQPHILGRVIGEITDQELIAHAEAIFEIDNAQDMADEREISVVFDVDLYLKLCDEQGRHYIVTIDEEDQRALIQYFGDRQCSAERDREIMAEHNALFYAFNDGREFTATKLADRLEALGRAVRYVGNSYSIDEAMPDELATEFFPSARRTRPSLQAAE
jgi:hypothetical protein